MILLHLSRMWQIYWRNPCISLLSIDAKESYYMASVYKSRYGKDNRWRNTRSISITLALALWYCSLLEDCWIVWRSSHNPRRQILPTIIASPPDVSNYPIIKRCLGTTPIPRRTTRLRTLPTSHLCQLAIVTSHYQLTSQCELLSWRRVQL